MFISGYRTSERYSILYIGCLLLFYAIKAKIHIFSHMNICGRPSNKFMPECETHWGHPQMFTPSKMCIIAIKVLVYVGNENAFRMINYESVKIIL